MELLREVMRYVPMAPWLVGLAALGLAVQSWLFVRGLKASLGGPGPARPGTWKLEVASPATVVSFMVLAVISIDRARALMTEARATTDAESKMARVAESFAGQLNGIPLMLGLFMVLVTWGTVAGCLAYCARRRAPLVTTAAAVVPVVAFGLLPVAGCGYQYAADLIRVSAQMIHHSGEEKLGMFDRTLSAWHGRFDMAFAVTCAGLAAAVVVSAFLLVLSSPARERRRRGLATEPPSRSTWSWVVVVAELAAAAGLLMLGRPLHAENATPWPPVGGSVEFVAIDVETPDLTGPDEVERAPVAVFRADAVDLDGTRLAGPVALGERLHTLASYYHLLHPGETFNGLLDVLCVPDRPASSMRAWLRAAALEDYEHAVLLFIQRQRLLRPLLGRIDRVTSSAARADLRVSRDGAEPPPGDAEVVDMRSPITCRELAARIVEHRRRGRQVILDLGRVRED